MKELMKIAEKSVFTPKYKTYYILYIYWFYEV